jgi:tRNA uridine 5-carbamoylmethylation protein Kti12
LDVKLEESLEWNSKKDENESKYEEKLIQEVFQRIEKPNSKTKWDNPLYVIITF